MPKIVFIFILSIGLAAFNRLSAQSASNDSLRVYRDLDQAMKNPMQVYHLKLSHKGYGIIPEQIFTFENLKTLDLSKNKIREIPPEIGKLKNLKELDISSNKLEVIPAGIGKLEKLQKLVLNRNDIDSLPPEMAGLTELARLELWDTSINRFPPEMKSLSKLVFLEMRGIMMSDEDQQNIRDLFPDAKIFFSPSCQCEY